jgi:lipopolysaccharide transport system permease protein
LDAVAVVMVPPGWEMDLMFFSFLFDKHDRATVRLLAEREIRSRIVGTYIGLGHYVLLPVLMLLVYSFMFSVVFQSKWVGAEDTFGAFAIRVFIGMIAFQFFSEVISRSPGLVLENPTYVKKVVFPLETLVPTTTVVSAFSALITFAVFLVAHLLLVGLPPLTTLWIPFIWPPLIMMTAGFAWVLASLGVFLRDLKQLVGVIVPALMFISPVFFPMAMVPKGFGMLILMNPISIPIEMMREAVFGPTSPGLVLLLGYYAGSFAMAQFGYWWFMRTKKAFADVI